MLIIVLILIILFALFLYSMHLQSQYLFNKPKLRLDFVIEKFSVISMLVIFIVFFLNVPKDVFFLPFLFACILALIGYFIPSYNPTIRR